MSRGLGRIERILLAALDQSPKPIDTFDLAVIAYDIRVAHDCATYITEARLVSVRRALRSLERSGRIFNIARGHNKRAYWGSRATSERWRADGFNPRRR